MFLLKKRLNLQKMFVIEIVNNILFVLMQCFNANNQIIFLNGFRSKEYHTRYAKQLKHHKSNIMHYVVVTW